MHRNKLRLGHLLGNRFVITITNLEQELDESMARSSSRCAGDGAVRRAQFFWATAFWRNGQQCASRDGDVTG